MNTYIDQQGRIYLPEHLLTGAGINKGQEVYVGIKDSTIVIKEAMNHCVICKETVLDPKESLRIGDLFFCENCRDVIASSELGQFIY